MTVCNFLGSLFKRKGTKRLTYSSICGYRTAISAFHDPLDGLKIGEHPSVSRVVKGVFNLQPPIKKVLPVWDLGLVLKALKGKPFEPLVNSSLKLFTLKTVFLVAMATAARGDDLSKLSCDAPFMRERKSPPSFVLLPTDLRKQSRRSHISEELVVSKFVEDRLVDPFRALKLYLKKVEQFRGNVKSLFITYGSGIKSAPVAQSIARWLVETIKLAYKLQHKSLGKVSGHSTRAMATSWALFNGASLESILRAADWSSTNVFAKHYLKKVEERRTEFCQKALKPTTA